MDGYVTRFHCRDGRPIEDYFCRTITEMLSHLNLFRNDDSGLNRSIEVVDAEYNKKDESICFC